MPNPQTPITTAKAPFDEPNAELILRSSDNVDFRVFKLFLSLSSPFFKNVFMLPQPVETGNEGLGFNDLKDDLPVIPMSESSEVIEELLMFCYPRWSAEPALKTLEEVQSVLEAAIKYDMEEVQRCLQKILVEPRFVGDELGHLRVFGIAFRYRLKDVAMVAMRHVRNHAVLGRLYVEELDHITPRAYHQLLDYHRRCSNAVVGLTTDLQWLPKDNWSNSREDWIPVCKSCQIRTISVNPGFSESSASKYFTDYLERAAAVLRDRPCSALALKSDLVDKALADTSNCVKCCKSAVGYMRNFTELFTMEIEKVASAVELNLVF